MPVQVLAEDSIAVPVVGGRRAAPNPWEQCSHSRLLQLQCSRGRCRTHRPKPGFWTFRAWRWLSEETQERTKGTREGEWKRRRWEWFQLPRVSSCSFFKTDISYYRNPGLTHSHVSDSSPQMACIGQEEWPFFPVKLKPDLNSNIFAVLCSRTFFWALSSFYFYSCSQWPKRCPRKGKWPRVESVKWSSPSHWTPLAGLCFPSYWEGSLSTAWARSVITSSFHHFCIKRVCV